MNESAPHPAEGFATRPAGGFYERVLDVANHPELARAFAEVRDVTGLTEEVALLRALLRATLERQPGALLISGLRLLVNVLLAQHRLSGQQAEDLVSSVAQTAEALRAVMAGDVNVAS